jgi:enoyl-CoA hydratase/carnithine racemase
MDYKTIMLECRNAGAWITLNRPKEMNAISLKMLDELEAAFDHCLSNDAIRAIVLTGSGPAFCAGADLNGFLASMRATKVGEKDFLDRIGDVFGLLRRIPKPVIAALNGATLAGGLELAMCCDIIFAAESAKIGDAHANFGVFPGAGGTAILPKKIGINRAKYLLFTGTFLSAAELERYGLVNRVIPDNMLMEEVENFIKILVLKSPLVLRRMKEVANASLDQNQDASLRHEMLELRQHLRSYDLEEGLNAFEEKRNPEFKGY